MNISQLNNLLFKAINSSCHKKFICKICDNLDKTFDQKMEEIEDGGHIALSVNSFGKITTR